MRKPPNISTDQAAPIPEQAIIKEYVIDDRTKPRIDFSSEDKYIPKNVQKIIESSLPKIKFPDIATRVHQPSASNLVVPAQQ